MSGKNIWRLCQTYGWLIGYPQLKPHDLRYGVAMEVYAQRHDLEQVRALLGHSRIEPTQVYARIRPAELNREVSGRCPSRRRVLARRATTSPTFVHLLLEQ